MSPTLVKLILLAEMHEELSRWLKWKLKVDEVGDKLAHSVEDYVLCKHLGDLHGLRLGLCSSFWLWRRGRGLLAISWGLVGSIACTPGCTLIASFLFLRVCDTASTARFRSTLLTWTLAEETALKLATDARETHGRQEPASGLSQALSCWLCFFLRGSLLFLLALLESLHGIVELQIYQSLQAQSPHFDFLPDLMLADVATEIHFDSSRVILVTSCSRGKAGRIARTWRLGCDCEWWLCGQVLFLEHEQELTGVHNRIELAQALRFSVRPENVKYTANDTAEHWETFLVFYDLWRSECLEELLQLLTSFLTL